VTEGLAAGPFRNSLTNCATMFKGIDQKALERRADQMTNKVMAGELIPCISFELL